MTRVLAALLALLAGAACARPAAAAEPRLILRGGRIFLGPGRYAQALSVVGNRVDAVGTDAEIVPLKGRSTVVLELRGRAAAPAFHDAHADLFKGALLATELDLRGAASFAEIRRRVAEYSAAHPERSWIVGRGWDEGALAAEGALTRQVLDAAISTRPVALSDDEGRALWLNTAALRAARISKLTPKLNKGDVVHDASGEPTGLLRDEATRLATRAMPQASRAQKLDALRKAQALLRERGVTSVDAIAGPDDAPDELVELWRELYKAGQTTTRLFVYGRLEDAGGAAKLRKAEAELPRTRFGIVGVAGAVDGSLASRSAALLAPYFDDPKQRGQPRHAQWRLNELVAQANAEGLQAALTAHGDRAARMALDACEKSERRARDKGYVPPRYPCRVEGVDVVAPEDLARFALLSAAASMQPARLAFPDEMSNELPNRLGDRAPECFAARALQDAGATVAFGTGWPGEALEPLLGAYEAVTRRMLDGKPAQGWMPQQRVSLEDAIAHWTADPARVIGRDEELGTLKPGKLADIVVFDRDIFSADPADLPQARVDYTIYDGRVVYDRANP